MSFRSLSMVSSCVLAVLSAGHAQAEPEEAAQPAEAEAAQPEAAQPEAAEAAEPSPWQQGPKKLSLDHGIEVDLPADYDFLPMPYAAQLMEKMGNLYNDGLLGLIASREEAPWFVTLRYDEEGYVKDDETIDADELLETMRDSLPDLNAEREKQGFLPLTLDGWDEKPHYDKAAHQLVWCLRISDAEGSSANYNTRILGRKGYVSVNLVTDPTRVATDKPHAHALLAATRFQAGNRYADFDPSKDKVAEYGLAGLVAGGAGFGAMKLVKLGIMAKMWKVILAALIAGKKVIFVALIGLAALLKKLFSKPTTDQA